MKPDNRDTAPTTPRGRKQSASTASGVRPALIAYRLNESPPALECAPAARAWMDATPERFAYRCLPLLIANQTGWFIKNQHAFEAMWDGGLEPSGVTIRNLAKDATGSVTSHFGSGILTWHLSYLFRTPPGYNLLVRGPSNWPKDAVQALEGLVESDWTSATFTMNWKLTRPNHWVRFDEGEPICMLVPQRRGELEEFHTELRDLKDHEELSAAHRRWSDNRSRFLDDLRQEGSAAADQKWQKHYFQGRSLDGGSSPGHQTVITLHPFIDPGAPAVKSTGARSSDKVSPRSKARVASARRPLQQPGYLLKIVDSKIVLYHPAKARTLSLNDTAAMVWELCNGERTTEELIQLLQEAFPEAATLPPEVESALATLAEEEAVAFI